MPDHRTATLQIRGPHDAIAVVPYLLGHHPSDHSLVAVGIRNSRVATIARIDLPTPADATAAAHSLLNLLRTNDITGLIVIGYGTAATVNPSIAAIRDSAPTAGIEVQEALRVTDGTYTSYLCANPDCHPAAGTPIDTASVIAVQAIAAGYTALANREAVAARITPATGAERDSIHAATIDALDDLARETAGAADPTQALIATGHREVAAAYQTTAAGRRLEPRDVARLSVLLTVTAVRDGAWPAIDGSHTHIDLWADITRRAEPGYRPAPASLLAYAAWRAGDGVLARIATDAALAADADYTLAQLIRQLLDLGTNPADLRHLADDQQ